MSNLVVGSGYSRAIGLHKGNAVLGGSSLIAAEGHNNSVMKTERQGVKKSIFDFLTP